jgi:hypothetical protein
MKSVSLWGSAECREKENRVKPLHALHVSDQLQDDDFCPGITFLAIHNHHHHHHYTACAAKATVLQRDQACKVT